MSYSTQRYQGYPYVNPIVTDAPSIAAAEASKWANLPRRVISTSRPSGSGTSKRKTNDGPSTSGSLPPVQSDDDDEENPVIYIDMPDGNGSVTYQNAETPDEREPDYLQNTILYDPFDNRRINVAKEEENSTSDQSSTEDEEAAGPSSSVSHNQRLNASNNAWRNEMGSSSSVQSPRTIPIPSLMEKESNLYGGHDSDGCPRSPIPILEFPEPPPAYTEMDVAPRIPAPAPTPSPQVPAISPAPQRTQVIVPIPDPVSPVGVMSYNRKYMDCHHCNNRVHTLVIRENGWFTYTIAIMLFIIILPLFVIVCCTDYFKHKNHYCPICNKLIGYQLPLIGNEMHLVS